MTVKERTVERISGQTVGGSERAERGSGREAVAGQVERGSGRSARNGAEREAVAGQVERGSGRLARNGAERAIERARQEKRNRRDGELCARLAERRTAAEMLRTISALRGLNVREREAGV